MRTRNRNIKQKEKKQKRKESRKKKKKQAGAELCQAQEKLELARNCGRLPLTLVLRSSLIYIEIGVVFHFAKN